MLHIKLRIILKKSSDSGSTSTISTAKTPKMTNSKTKGTTRTEEIMPTGVNVPSMSNCTGIVASCAPAETARSCLSRSKIYLHFESNKPCSTESSVFFLLSALFAGNIFAKRARIFGLKKKMPYTAEYESKNCNEKAAAGCSKI